jgi:CheY-like chemotaxis protein
MVQQHASSILLVEDNIAHAYLIRRLLVEQNLVSHIEHVDDGEQALSLFTDPPLYDGKPFRPNLVLLDAGLPKVSGLEVLRYIKSSSNFRNIPVIMLTTAIAERDVAAAYALQANGYLVKPMEPSQFAGMLTNVVRYWLQWNHSDQKPEALHEDASDMLSPGQRPAMRT